MGNEPLNDKGKQGMEVKRSQVGWIFWILYVLATTLGMFLGFVLGFLLLVAIPHGVLGNWLSGSILGIALGIGVGTLQRTVLWRRVSGGVWWILASAVGGLLTLQAAFFFGFSTSYASLGALLGWIGIVALAGVATGTLQWVVLRKQFSRAGWWVLASAVGWTVSVIGVRALPWGMDDSDALWGMVATGVVFGALTGAVLIWLFRQPISVNGQHT